MRIIAIMHIGDAKKCTEIRAFGNWDSSLFHFFGNWDRDKFEVSVNSSKKLQKNYKNVKKVLDIRI